MHKPHYEICGYYCCDLHIIHVLYGKVQILAKNCFTRGECLSREVSRKMYSRKLNKLLHPFNTKYDDNNTKTQSSFYNSVMT